MSTICLNHVLSVEKRIFESVQFPRQLQASTGILDLSSYNLHCFEVGRLPCAISFVFCSLFGFRSEFKKILILFYLSFLHHFTCMFSILVLLPKAIFFFRFHHQCDCSSEGKAVVRQLHSIYHILTEVFFIKHYLKLNDRHHVHLTETMQLC